MKNAWKSIKALLASEDDDETEDLIIPEKGAAKKTPEKKKDDSDDEDPDDDEESEKGKDKDKEKGKGKKKPAAETEAGEDKAETANVVHLALDDYNGLMALATTAKSATAENKKLKAKADQWDSYQAALSGNKPANDSAGSTESEKETGKGAQTEEEKLRAKHGKLFDDM